MTKNPTSLPLDEAVDLIEILKDKKGPYRFENAEIHDGIHETLGRVLIIINTPFGNPILFPVSSQD